ncbi:MAG TPA: hypothetical protein VIL09_00525 [Microvirga sp.]|jgi:hypothetical protein
MSSIRPSSFLRLALLGDALASGATGILAFAGAGLLADPLGLPVPMLHLVGLVLIAYAAAVAWVGTRPVVSSRIVWTIVVLNGIWALDSVLLLASGWVAPTALGIGFVVFQALVVAGFAAAQAHGLRDASAGGTVPA